MFKRVVLCCLVAAVLLVPLSAASMSDVLPDLTQNQLESLAGGHLLEGASFEGRIDQLVPTGSIARNHVLESVAKPESFTVISLSFVPYPEDMLAMSPEDRQVKVFNTLRSISTQEGIIYISYRAGNKPKTLIEKSWYLETPKSRTGIADPVSDSVPPTAEYYVFQRDTSFKGNVYRHRYTTTDDEIFVKIENLEVMRVFGLLKAVDPEQLAMAMATYQLDDGLLLSAMATIEGRDPKINVLGYEVDLPSAFTRRITALGEWFVDQLNK